VRFSYVHGWQICPNLGHASEATLALNPVSFRYKKDVDLQGIRQFVGQTTNEVTCETNQRKRKKKQREK
jgi:hypothetical protein